MQGFGLAASFIGVGEIKIYCLVEKVLRTYACASADRHSNFLRRSRQCRAIGQQEVKNLGSFGHFLSTTAGQSEQELLESALSLEVTG